MAKTLTFDETAARRAAGQARALGAALRELRGALDAAAAGGANARMALQALPGAVQAAAAPVQAALNPALGSLGALARGAAENTGRLSAVLGGQTTRTAKTAARAVTRVGTAAGAAAQAAQKAVRTLASFDEIERLGAAARQTAESAGGSGGSGAAQGALGGQSGPAGAALAEVQTLPGALQTALAALQNFWQSVQTLYAPAIAAWQNAWALLRSAALAVWGPVQAASQNLWQNALVPLAAYLTGTFLPGVFNSLSQAFAPILGGAAATAVVQLASLFTTLASIVTQAVQSVVMPLLALALQIWQDAMAGVQAAWAAYGQPVLAGAAAAVQNLCAILLAFWSGTLQPLLQNLIARLGALWQSTLQPLFNDLALAVGSVVNLLLTLWNTALAPLLNFLVSSFGPLAAQVFTALAGGVALAVQTAGGALDSLLILLRGLADFLTQGLLGRWTEAWAAMGEAVRGAWQRITSTVQGAVSGLLALVSDFAVGVVRAVNNALSALASLRSRAAAGGGSAASARSARTAFYAAPSLANPPRVPALAAGAVIPPNREFLALLGDQRQGVNIEAPLDTIRQAFAETLAAWEGGQGQPINIYLGDELLDTVIARSQSRRTLRSGGRR